MYRTKIISVNKEIHFHTKQISIYISLKKIENNEFGYFSPKC